MASAEPLSAPPALAAVLLLKERGGSKTAPRDIAQPPCIKQFMQQYTIAKELQEKGVKGIVQLRKNTHS